MGGHTAAHSCRRSVGYFITFAGLLVSVGDDLAALRIAPPFPWHRDPNEHRIEIVTVAGFHSIILNMVPSLEHPHARSVRHQDADPARMGNPESGCGCAPSAPRPAMPEVRGASAAFASIVIGTNFSFAMAPDTNAHGNFFDASPNKPLHSEQFERAD
jgi:hypothetical protein